MNKDDEVLGFIYSNGQWDGTTFCSFDEVKILFNELGNPQDKIKSIHVAGTNGKGSVCSMLSSILMSSGFSVSQFVSPHLSKVVERCLLNGKEVDEESYLEAAKFVIATSRRLEIQISFFVLTAAVFFILSNKYQVDFMVVETGLGGRLDATNLIKKPEATVLTNISLEHQDWLGDSIAKIATEKACIGKSGAKMFVGSVSDQAIEAIRVVSKEKKFEVLFLNKDLKFKNFKLSLNGKHQQHNANLAYYVGKELNLSEESILTGLEEASWPARLEEITIRRKSDSRDFVLDVAHNPDGLKTLLEYLEEKDILFWQKELVFVVSILDRKDYKKMIEMFAQFYEGLEGKNCKFIFTEADSAHAVKMDVLASLAIKNGILESSILVLNREDCFDYFLSEKGCGKRFVVTGSVYLVGEVRARLNSWV